MEQEIRKSVRSILRKVKDKEKGIWNKVGEIFIEMLIIIFAVSFAVWMERRREHNHEQKEVKDFLIGLRSDLRNDTREMEEDKMAYDDQAKWFKYFSDEENLNRDTVYTHRWVLWNTINLVINNGRYEGFKESGKMNTIENVELRNQILDVYQETLLSLTNTTGGYTTLKKELHRLLYSKRRNAGKANDNLAEILKEEEIKNYCLQLKFTNEPVRRYDSAISSSTRIIELINKEYPEN